MGWDNITQTGARASGVEELDSSNGGASYCHPFPTQNGIKGMNPDA
jgi:hypothetical protein